MAKNQMFKKMLIIAIAWLLLTFPYCSGMIVAPVSGGVFDERTLLPIEAAQVMIDVGTPRFGLHELRNSPFIRINATTDEKGLYRTEWVFGAPVTYRFSLGRMYTVVARKDGYEIGGGWSMEYYTGIVSRHDPLEKWLVRSPLSEAERTYARDRDRIRELLDIHPLTFRIDEITDAQAHEAKLRDLTTANRWKKSLDYLLRAALFHEFQLRAYAGASRDQIERLDVFCQNLGHLYGRSEPIVKEKALEFLRGTFGPHDVSSLAKKIAISADRCLKADTSFH